MDEEPLVLESKPSTPPPLPSRRNVRALSIPSARKTLPGITSEDGAAAEAAAATAAPIEESPMGEAPPETVRSPVVVPPEARGSHVPSAPQPTGELAGYAANEVAGRSSSSPPSDRANVAVSTITRITPQVAHTPVGVPPRAPALSRPSATELLFESMGDLPLFETPLEAASFCLNEIMRVMRGRAALVHLLDMPTGDFVCICAMGSRASSLLGSRVTDDWMIEGAASRGAPLAMEYEGEASASPRPRHAFFGDPWNVIVVPVLLRGRCVAVIELVDAVDDSALSTDGLHALGYVAERLSAFLAERTLVVPHVIAP